MRGLSTALAQLAARYPELELREGVTLLLMKELSQEQDAFPSLRYLSERLRCSPSAARSSIRTVERAGLVRRTERFVACSTGGVRQTSNRYHLIESPRSSARRMSRPVDVLEDAADPRQLELSKDAADSWEGSATVIAAPPPPPAPPPASVPAPEQASEPEAAKLAAPPSAEQASQPSLPEVGCVEPVEAGGAVASPAPVEAPAEESAARALTEPPPLLPSTPPPYCPAQGIEELRVKRKANSTRACAPPRAKALTQADASPSPAAAFLDQVLTPETTRELKRRFGLPAYGSLLYALRRNACVEHPEVAQRALEQLLAAPNVHNPGAYFFRVFSDELAALQLLSEPSPEDLALEREREHAEAFRARQQALLAELERVQCVDWERAERVRAELAALLQRERRRRQSAEGGSRPAPGAREASAPPPSPARGLSATELAAESERVLAMLRGRPVAA